jgi:hypothetical protein
MDHAALVEGTWVEVRGVLGQETTGAQPQRGYRVWPAMLADLRVTATTTDPGAAASDGDGTAGGDESGTGSAIGDLGDLDASSNGGVVGATLVVGPWPQLGLAGVLWDGERLVGLATTDATSLAATIRGRRLPVALEIHGLRAAGTTALGIPLAELGEDADAVVVAGRGAPPSTRWPQATEAARWFASVGRLDEADTGLRLRSTRGVLAIDRRCASDEPLPRGTVSAMGIALPGGEALIVPCGGVVAGAHLGRLGATADRAGLALHADDADAAATSPRSDVGTGAIAAGLVGLAALALGATAAWMRWRPADPGPASSADDPPGADATDPSDDPVLPPPVLTLVPMPRERGP